MDKVAELIKAGKIREISDMRDETDLGGLKLTIDLKRGADPEKLMQKLFRMTPLQDSFACNFNILIAGMPRVMGVGEILAEWTAWRTDCVKRRIYLPDPEEAGAAAPIKGSGKDPAGYRPGHCHHSGDGAGERSGAQSDDRLRHRRDPGGIRCGDQAAQHQ